MTDDSRNNRMARLRFIAGWILTALPSLLLLFSAAMALVQPEPVVESFANYGFTNAQATGIGITALVCTLIYLVPRTSVLGAILLTGYLGGAVVTHVRAGEPFVMAVVVGIVVWGGLYLRDARIRALVPWRASAMAATSDSTTEIP